MFSVIIPTYNRASVLINCLQCLSMQLFKSFEVIVIDDGSTDNTAEICEKFYTHLDLKYIHLKHCSGGPAFPRNIGIENSKYDWIAFLDSDDIWSSNKLQVIVEQITLNPDVNFIFHDFIGIQAKFIVQPNNLLEQLFLNGNIIVNSSVVVKKKILNKLNGFDTNRKLISAEDYDLWIRIALETDNYLYLDEPLGTYSFTQDSISLNYKRKLLNFQYLYYKHQRLYNKKINYIYIFIKSYIKHLLLFIKQEIC
jgi:glycosyltransferase involved in cell wall biosynthesis